MIQGGACPAAAEPMYVNHLIYQQQQAAAAAMLPYNNSYEYASEPYHGYEYSLVAPGIVGPEQNGLTQDAGQGRPGYFESTCSMAVGDPTSSSCAASSTSSQHANQTPPAETEVVGPQALCPDQDEEAMPVARRSAGRPLNPQWGQEAGMMHFVPDGVLGVHGVHWMPHGQYPGYGEYAFASGYDIELQQVLWNQQAQGNNGWPENPVQSSADPRNRNTRNRRPSEKEDTEKNTK